MISVEAALEKILSYVDVLESEEKPILDCLGQVLAEDIYSTLDIPPMDNSAMDGYAVRAEDSYGASKSSPRNLVVVGELAAGAMPHAEVAPGTAIRIMTGAPLPKGADAVIQFEDTDEAARKSSGADLSQIGILRQADKGLNVRCKGEDIVGGELVLERGKVLRPSELGVLASVGRSVVRVVRRPVVAVLATGNELLDIDQPLDGGKIHNSNTYTIAGQVLRYGGIPKIIGIAQDAFQSLSTKIEEGLCSDMLITSGGVSLGDYDIVKEVLASRGEIAFQTVCMRPGKPSAFGVIVKVEGGKEKRVPHLGLPGNPVSSMVSFEQFARPAILKMMGRTNFAKPTVQAIIEEDVANLNGRRMYVRAIVTTREGKFYARLTGRPHGSGVLTSMAKANGLAMVPEHTEGVKAGDIVQVQMLDWSGDLM
jgi:molybdopterin molybdotransferase